MESENTYLSNNFKNVIIIIILPLFIAIIFLFKNVIFESTILLKNLGNLSIEPEIAFSNQKPTYLEFYAEWCEICKEMAPEVTHLKNEYDEDMNFVFLNVDNPKWDKFVKEFKVNGIPQINLIDSNSNLITTFTGLQGENTLNESIKYLIKNKTNFKK